MQWDIARSKGHGWHVERTTDYRRIRTVPQPWGTNQKKERISIFWRVCVRKITGQAEWTRTEALCIATMSACLLRVTQATELHNDRLTDR